MSLILTKRLQVAADFVRSGRKTADVGTDHGYLPAFLVLKGITENAIAADIGVGPLENARKTVEKYELEKNIQLILSDGLENIPDDTQEIVIAGMGGTLMAEILGAADWIKNPGIHLVLQPMTHSQDVRQYLCENGFYIDEEKTVEDSGKVYIVMSAYYSGEKSCKDAYYYYFGDKINADSDTDIAYIKKQCSYLSSRYKGLVQSGDTEKAQLYRDILGKAERDGKSL